MGSLRLGKGKVRTSNLLYPLHLGLRELKLCLKVLMVKALVWNVRGIGGVNSKTRVCNLCRIHNIQLLVLMEPFISINKLVATASSLGFTYSYANCSNKIWIMWNSCINVHIISDFPQVINTHIFCFNIQCYFSFVYAACSRLVWLSLWEQLVDFIFQFKGPWCIGGDFNIISNAFERVGGKYPNFNAMEDFNSMIQDCNLHDIGFSGGSFTWSRASMWQRLDRFLFNNEWIADFTMTRVEHLSRTHSDHAPLLLNVNDNNLKGISAFRFQNMWLLHEDFMNRVQTNWNAPVYPNNDVTGMIRLWSKLSRLKQILRWWNKNIFRNIFINIIEAENKVIDMDKVCLDNPSNENFQKLNDVKLSHINLQNQEEMFWRQRANTKIILEGDRNTKFFHALANKNRIKNHINKISNQDGVFFDTEDSIIKFGSIVNFLLNFQNMSGLPINNAKSNFIIANSVPRSRINLIQRICGFHSKLLPIKYLGTPIFKGRKTNKLFEDLFTLFQRKFSNWSSKFLSFGGRLVLIKSVLNSIPIFLFHTLLPNVSVCFRLERMINKFFWGSNSNRKGICWTSWFKVCGIFKEGGLDCKSISDMAHAFSHKLWFAFRSNTSLWAQFMNLKYCKVLHPLLCSYKRNDSLVWKRLCSIKWEAENYIQWGLGKGDISFWQDNWLGIGSIDSILNTHTIENRKVKSFFLNNSWNIIKLREALPGHLIDIILSIPLQMNCKDKILFTLSNSGHFSLKEAWNTFRVKYAISPLYSVIWNANIPLSYSILVWRCLKNCILVDANLWKKGFIFPSKCQCCSSIDTINHVFINGDIAFKNFHKCLFLAHEFGISHHNVASNTMVKLVRWIKPSLPFVKLNTDGSVGTNVSGAGGIIRNEKGTLLAAFASPLNVCNVTTAELLGLVKGLDLCNRMGFNFVWIEVDANWLIHIFEKGEEGSPQNFYVIRKIKQHLATITYSMSHIYREVNSCADWFAKYGCQLDSLIEFNSDNLPPMLFGAVLGCGSPLRTV
ncbi:hypothetical protein M5K25_016231 [Dendrobium thyrsiflorum]|uniref:Uncharacterized protein n=1 Tax=Dendrobium thyrsiflorum TaxID=117978 RepID=A0ABD0URA5_DENTH